MIYRVLEGSDTYVILVNIGEEAETVNLKEPFPYLEDDLTIVALTIYSEQEAG